MREAREALGAEQEKFFAALRRTLDQLSFEQGEALLVFLGRIEAGDKDEPTVRQHRDIMQDIAAHQTRSYRRRSLRDVYQDLLVACAEFIRKGGIVFPPEPPEEL